MGPVFKWYPNMGLFDLNTVKVKSQIQWDLKSGYVQAMLKKEVSLQMVWS